MTATPATAAAHTHAGGIEHYHEIASARELRLHLFYGHDLDASSNAQDVAHDALIERHRQAHAGDEAVARGAQLAADFNAAGRKIPEGAASAAPAASGQTSEGAARRDASAGSPSAPTAPSGYRSIYPSDGNDTLYIAEEVGVWEPAPDSERCTVYYEDEERPADAVPLYRLTLEPTEPLEGVGHQGVIAPGGPAPATPSGLPAYRPDATCPKCGHDDVDTAYLSNGRAYECSCKLLCRERGEHLHRRCRRCTFTWPEAVIKMSALPRPATDTGGEDVDTLPAGPPVEARP